MSRVAGVRMNVSWGAHPLLHDLHAPACAPVSIPYPRKSLSRQGMMLHLIKTYSFFFVWLFVFRGRIMIQQRWKRQFVATYVIIDLCWISVAIYNDENIRGKIRSFMGLPDTPAIWRLLEQLHRDLWDYNGC